TSRRGWAAMAARQSSGDAACRVCMGRAPEGVEDVVGPLRDPFAVAATVRHLFDLQARMRGIEEGGDAAHGAAVVLLAPLGLAGAEHRDLPGLAYRLHQLRDEAFHLRRRAPAVV